MGATPLELQAGEPFAAKVTITDGKSVWGTLGSFEVRWQVRRFPSETSELLSDLSGHCTAGYVGNDIVITLVLSGQVTRSVPRRSGHYDVFISDPGATDARAFRILWGSVSITPAVTTAS